MTFDLWGDTVNVVSRMEHYATPDSIRVTEATYQLLRDDFIFESLGLADIKGKGGTLTYAFKTKTEY